MTGRDRMTVAKAVAANIAVAGAFYVGVAVTAPASAAADPDAPLPPADPGGEPPSPGVSEVIAQPIASILGQPAQSSSGAPVDFMLSQRPLPSAPNAEPLPPMDLNAAMSGGSSLMPQNFRMAQPDEGNMYSVGQSDPNEPGLIPVIRGGRAIWHAGMGRLTPEQLGQPLPGTAPPPGTSIPPGVEQFYEPPGPPGVPPPPPPPGG